MDDPLLSMEVADPTVDYRDAPPRPTRAPRRPTSLDRKVISFVANWKPASIPFLGAIAAELEHRHPVKKNNQYNPGWVFEDRTLAEQIKQAARDIALESDLVVTGVGD